MADLAGTSVFDEKATLALAVKEATMGGTNRGNGRFIINKWHLIYGDANELWMPESDQLMNEKLNDVDPPSPTMMAPGCIRSTCLIILMLKWCWCPSIWIASSLTTRKRLYNGCILSWLCLDIIITRNGVCPILSGSTRQTGVWCKSDSWETLAKMRCRDLPK